MNQYFISSNEKAFLSRLMFISVRTISSKEVVIESEKMNVNNFYIESAILAELEKQQSDRFYNFKIYCVQSHLQKVFMINLKLSLLLKPQNYKEFKNHSYEK